MHADETGSDTHAERIDPVHLKEFSKHLEAVKKRHLDENDKFQIDPKAGRSIASYELDGNHLRDMGDISQKHTRKTLRQLAQSAQRDNLEFACASIFAWGGMDVRNFGKLFKSPDKKAWLDEAWSTKDKNSSRRKSFEKFCLTSAPLGQI